ncbi:ssRNA exonuclease [Martiniozyma asiatica (nom. inval.)]|nr:ssRNA exonuclease [Martiniozyma asiatica]
MGVPAFFRWLTNKYGKTISPCIEVEPDYNGGFPQPVNIADPNPNGELDNLYLDMNGIVHPCSHPENRPPPETEEEMMLEVFKYTDRIMNIARPRKVLMIAVDGVAPRAKMNQQRSRRFRSAKDAEIAHQEKEREMDKMRSLGKDIDDAVQNKKAWDSNSITPGTPFMDILAQALKYWTAHKVSTEPGWENLQIIISDATVPGEGEHKIMNFIRSQRNTSGYSPNTTHCIYGLDADLIFLSLATHEPHFRVLREDVFNDKRRYTPAQITHMSEVEREALKNHKTPFIWLHVNILREYLEHELFIPRLPFPFDFERAIDDWVFMCFFAGNDFLPHMPSLDVRDDAVKVMSTIWKQILPQMGGYLTCDGTVNLKRVEKLMREVTKREPNLIKKKRDEDIEREARDKQKNERNKARRTTFQVQMANQAKAGAPVNPAMNMTLTNLNNGDSKGMTNSEIVKNITALSKANNAKVAIEDVLKQEESSKDESLVSSSTDPSEESLPIDVSESTDTLSKTDIDDEEAEDQILNGQKLVKSFSNKDMWDAGYYKRYYAAKMHAYDEEAIAKVSRDMVRCYIEGISWVLLYYYQGCPSWNWYYPYHYAPFAQDFVDLNDLKIKFNKGKPFHPYEQLMSVLPAASGHNVPAVFRPLMSHPDSEIIDFYPDNFQIDMNGERLSWRGITILPFIDEQRLLAAVQAKYPELTPEESDRNAHKHEMMFVGKRHPLFKKITKLYKEGNGETNIQCFESGLAGRITAVEGYKPHTIFKYPLGAATEECVDLSTDDFVMVQFSMPEKVLNKSMLLNGYKSHNRVVEPYDITRPPRRNFRQPFDTSIDFRSVVGPSSFALSLTPRMGGYQFFGNAYREATARNSYNAANLAGQQQLKHMYENSSNGGISKTPYKRPRRH